MSTVTRQAVIRILGDKSLPPAHEALKLEVVLEVAEAAPSLPPAHEALKSSVAAAFVRVALSLPSACEAFCHGSWWESVLCSGAGMLA